MKLWRKPFDYTEKATTLGQVFIDEERCKGCGFCVEFCPREVLKMSTELSPKGYNLAVVEDESKCLACGFCEVICPEFAIRVSTSDNNK
ncbi:MAG: 4Fe-4S binding protein [Dehalococcoidia bacterium]|nr:4Fe-4S binding protein [Dehalococcoidia bacterium]